MLSEEKLAKELNKLEIAPVLPQEGDILPLSLNPFYNVPISTATQKDQHYLQHQNYRKWRLRRHSESLFDNSSQLRTDLNCVDPVSGTRLAFRVHRQQFKTTFGSISRKRLLREPVLGTLHTFCRPENSARRQLLVPPVVNKFLSSANMVQVCDISSTSLMRAGMSDFRELVKECQTLLGQNADENSRNTEKLSNGLEMFTNRKVSFPKCNILQCTNSDNDVRTNSNLFPNSIIPSTPTTAIEYINVSSRASTSCSQQAGTGASNVGCDDINIDELASYFDTLVHIPRKMSSMAEMMYI